MCEPTSNRFYTRYDNDFHSHAMYLIYHEADGGMGNPGGREGVAVIAAGVEAVRPRRGGGGT